MTIQITAVVNMMYLFTWSYCFLFLLLPDISNIDNSSNLPLIDLSFHDNSSDTQCQITTEQGPTDREVEEISSVLSNLKSLALDVQVEEDKQLKNLDQLTDSVNRGNDKLGNLNRKIKTLLR